MKTLFGEIEFEQPSKCRGHADVPGHGPKGETLRTRPQILDGRLRYGHPGERPSVQAVEAENFKERTHR